jgi:hypothetical protein
VKSLSRAAGVGYRLVLELTAGRPMKPGPEWWLLLDLAIDADDVTRRTACGFEYMEERTHAPRSTIYRWLQQLHKDGLVVTAEKAAGSAYGRKGRRAVYEIQVPPRLAARIGAQLGQVSAHGTKAGESGLTGADQSRSQVWSQPVGSESARTGSLVPPTVGPPITGPHRTGTEEGACLRSEQDRGEEEDKKNTHPERGARRAPAA